MPKLSIFTEPDVFSMNVKAADSAGSNYCELIIAVRIPVSMEDACGVLEIETALAIEVDAEKDSLSTGINRFEIGAVATRDSILRGHPENAFG